MTEQVRLIQHEDLPLFTGIPDPVDVTETSPVDALLIVTQQLQAEQETRMQLQRDVREWMTICEGLRAMLEQAKAQVDVMADANAKFAALATERLRWAQTWKQAAKAWRGDAIISLATIEKSAEPTVTERADMAQARYVVRELMNLIEGWEHLPACPRWLSNEAERLAAGAPTEPMPLPDNTVVIDPRSRHIIENARGMWAESEGKGD